MGESRANGLLYRYCSQRDRIHFLFKKIDSPPRCYTGNKKQFTLAFVKVESHGR